MSSKVPVIGIGPDGLAGLSPRGRELLLAAEVVFGSEGTLRLLPELPGERVVIGTDLPVVVEKLKAAVGKRVTAIVASGDPLFYGTARYLTEKVGPELFEVMPHVSSMQLAFARLRESWEEAFLTDLAARSLDDVLDKIRSAETVGLFTSPRYQPSRVAAELLGRGMDYFTAFVCENLGGKDERITRADLGEVRDMTFDPLNILILKRKPNRPDRPRAARLRRFGNPDEVFAQTRPKTGLITQAEVRGVALSQLDLHPGDVFWDVGAGSGSVAIEAAGLVHPAPSYAIEQDTADYHLIVANAAQFGVSNVKPVYGSAPAVFADLPAPDAVFVGGNGGEVARLLEAAYAALRPGGRLVTNVGTLEMLTATYAVLKRLGGGVEVLLMNLSRGVEQLEALRFEAINPTFLLRVQKPAADWVV
ncbi:precorrin-6y C5,15-methyltransferase (decarboxylating) subunit CbiE [Urbifossiella limnaea]|uniref:Precorrin-6Y C(5,15)-methyltransferase [decarboxylating] n=1 Tax=Urbifossiella limnaea TaxID=2528023 RepID=A0A517XM02_9BACT|nr:precorrin-6y C5,15-methyltransferase (decarboxylating) subunit CbiE [Urbifossiella limnaea]QDU18538.1 Precorrin-6Y C(5,15)-methyltransferase [decarboxylating] [Urbifossiella limnaea]